MDRTCSEASCASPWVARGLCTKHYQRLRKHGSTEPHEPRQRGACSVAGCDGEHYGKGYCRSHWVQFCKARCTIDGCDKPQAGNGWCAAHYRAARLHGGDPLGGEKRQKSGGPCSTADCVGVAATLGLCSSCYNRSRRNGSPESKRGRRCRCLEIDVEGFSGCGDGKAPRRPTAAGVPNRVTLTASACELVITRRNGVEVMVLFDREDADWIMSVQWQLDPAGYVVTRCPHGRLPARMHRLVAGMDPDDRMDPDHIDGVRTNNRRSNLRIVTHARNGLNTAIVNGSGTSRYRGVCWVTKRRHWVGYVKVDGKFRYIGSFSAEDAAAEAVAQYRRERGLPVGY